jgi:hypothetical protein
LGKPPRAARPGGRELTQDFKVPAAGNAGAAARRELDTLAEHVDHMTLAKLRLLVSELVNRAAAADPGTGSVPVSVSITAERVRAVVAGSGVTARRGLDWALFLVERMADRWGMAGEVWFELDHPPPKSRPGR